jgi:hypothetical protein
VKSVVVKNQSQISSILASENPIGLSIATLFVANADVKQKDLLAYVYVANQMKSAKLRVAFACI